MTDDTRKSGVIVVWVALISYLSGILTNINVYVETKRRFPNSVQQDIVSTDVVEISDTNIAHGKTTG